MSPKIIEAFFLKNIYYLYSVITIINLFLMATKSYVAQIDSAQVMTTGLTQYADQVAKRGLDPAFTETLRTTTEKAIALNAEQERLKAELKTKTAELDNALTEIGRQMSEAVKVVKISVPQTEWKAFGISAKK